MEDQSSIEDQPSHLVLQVKGHQIEARMHGPVQYRSSYDDFYVFQTYVYMHVHVYLNAFIVCVYTYLLFIF